MGDGRRSCCGNCYSFKYYSMKLGTCMKCGWNVNKKYGGQQELKTKEIADEKEKNN